MEQGRPQLPLFQLQQVQQKLNSNIHRQKLTNNHQPSHGLSNELKKKDGLNYCS